MSEHPIEAWLKANADLVPSKTAMAEAIGVTPGRLSQVLSGYAKPSAELAQRIHRITRGGVPASLLRPDLWRNPADVPTPAEAPAGEAQ